MARLIKNSVIILLIYFVLLPLDIYSLSPVEAIVHDDFGSLERYVKEGGDANNRDSDGATLLMHAVKHDRLAMITFLLAHGADPEAKDHQGREVLDYVQWSDKDIKPGSLTIVSGLLMPEYEKFATLTKENQEAYAKKHGYGYAYYDKPIDKDRPIEWNSIAALIKEMGRSSHKTWFKRFEWLSWISDMVIVTRPDLGLAELINTKYDVTISNNGSNNGSRPTLSSSILIIKNSLFAKKFLMHVWLEGARHDHWLRPGIIMQTLYDTTPDYRVGKTAINIVTTVLDPAVYLSFYPDSMAPCGVHRIWQPGDFFARILTDWDKSIPKQETLATIVDQILVDPAKEPDKLAQYNLRNAVLGICLKDVKEALSAGADVNARDDSSTLLMYASHISRSEGGEKDIVRELIDHGADVNAQDSEGRTALMFAVQEKFDDAKPIIKLLLSHGANVNATDSLGKTALMLCAEQGQENFIEMLINHGAQINVKDNQGRTALSYAAERTQTVLSYATESTYLSLEADNIIDLLLKHGADMSIRDKSDKIAANYAREDSKKLLVGRNDAAVLEAIDHDDFENLKKLIDAGISLVAYDRDGATPLMHAIKYDRMPIITFLLKNNVDIGAKDKQGRGVLDYVQWEGDAIKPDTFAMVSISTPGREPFANITKTNQMDYAKKHRYGYAYYTTSFDTERPEEWSKIAALIEQMDKYTVDSNKKHRPEWLLWIDDDIVITNPSITLEKFIKENPGYEIIIAKDALVPINNGIFLIKNSLWAKKFLMDVWIEGFKRNRLERGKTLLEQSIMTDLYNEDGSYSSKIKILEQREMNSFIRSSQRYPNDPENSKWQPGDFAAHVTGMSTNEREKIIKQLMEDPSKKPEFEKTNFNQKIWEEAAGPAADAQNWYVNYVEKLAPEAKSSILQACYFAIFGLQAKQAEQAAWDADQVLGLGQIVREEEAQTRQAAYSAALQGGQAMQAEQEAAARALDQAQKQIDIAAVQARKAWQAAARALDQAQRQIAGEEAWLAAGKAAAQTLQAMYVELYNKMVHDGISIPTISTSFGSASIGAGKALPTPDQIAKLIWFNAPDNTIHYSGLMH